MEDYSWSSNYGLQACICDLFTHKGSLSKARKKQKCKARPNFKEEENGKLTAKDNLKKYALKSKKIQREKGSLKSSQRKDHVDQ